MRWIALLSVLCGCFGLGGSEAPGPLENTQWAAPIDGYLCSINFSFPDERNYAFGIGCTLQDGSAALSIVSGTYTATRNQFTMTAMEASCPSSTINRVVTEDYARRGEQLTIFSPTGATVFTRQYPDGTTGGTVAFGCFDDYLVFTPMAVHPL